MKKKALSLLLVGAMLSAALTGCGGSNVSGASADASEGPQTLTVWCWDASFNLNAMYEAEKIYQKDHPDFTLDVVEIKWEDIQAKLTETATSGDMSTLPDIFLMQDNAFQKNVISYPDIVVDLTKSGVDFSQFAAGKVAYSVINGKNYGVPFDNAAVIGCYRTDYLEQAGLTVDDFTDITFDQYIENGKKVLEATGKPIIAMQAGECDLIMMMMQSAGSSLFHEDNSAYIVGNDTLKIVMETYKEMKDAGILIEVDSWDAYVDSLVNGEVAGVINGCWVMASIQIAEDQAGNWAVTNMPRLLGASGATNYSNNGGSSWAVSANCQNKKLAFDFLANTFAGSTELYDNILPSGALATWAPAGDSAAYAIPNDFFGGDAVSAKIVEYSTKVPSNITGVYYYEGRSAIATAITNYINGADLESEMQKAEDTVNINMQ